MYYKNGSEYFQKVTKLIVCILLLTLNISAQNKLNIITSAFNDFSEHRFTEKIYTHTDKNFYLTGEIIWFKLYNTDATFHKPSDISKVAYVEILDTANKPILQAKIGLLKGEGNGSFYLPQSITSGNYKIRAYTNWMKNFDASYFFEKNITIVNVKKIQASAIPDTTNNYDLKFFPEGGDLVNGLQSIVGFKGVDKDGKGFDFTGSIVDNADTIVKFQSRHAGMGNFVFMPQSNHTYRAIITAFNGTTFTTELPIIYANGYNMHIADNGNGKVNVTVQCNISVIKEMYLVAHTRASLKYSGTAVLQNGKASFIIDKSVLDDGISQFTLFNDQQKPVSERLYFKKPLNTLQLAVNTNANAFSKRSKVNIDVSNADVSNTDIASLSMAVYRLDSLQTVDDNTIETYLLLSSDLRGNIETPGYYFNASEKDAATALNDLMLTQGWRRFKWDDVLRNEKPVFEFMPEFNGHIITGKVINTKTGEPQKYIETFLSVPGIMTQFKGFPCDAKGMVRYEMTNFYGGTSIIAQPNTVTDSISKIEIDDPFSKQYSERKIPAFYRPINYPNTLLDQSISMQVQNIYTSDKQKQFAFPANVDTSSFYVTPDLKYALDDYTRFTSMEEVLREYVAMVNVNRRGGRVYLPILNVSANQFFQTDPLVLLDGVPIFDFAKFLNFDPLKIRNLDVLTRRYIYGSSVYEGILNWKTYAPTLANYEFPPNATVMDYEGLQVEREFYSPAYSTPELRSGHLPDFRNVLQWTPNIKLNGNNKTTIEFYTSDLLGKYIVVVEGLSQNGLCGSKTITFDVTK